MRKVSNHEEMMYRDTDLITLQQIGQDFLRPERLRLQLGDTRVQKSPIDIGSLAYSKRGKNGEGAKSLGNIVVESSLVEGRRELVMRLLDSLIGLRDRSIRLYLYLVDSVIDWLNDNGYLEIFSDAIQACEAYAAYTAYLNRLVMTQKILPRTACSYQRALQKIIKLQVSDGYQYVIRSAPSISPQGNPIRPPRQSDVQMFKDVCLAIALRFSEFILNNEPYPCVVKIRNYEVVRFPSKSGAISQFKSGPACYDAEEKRIATVDQYQERSANKGVIYSLSAAQRAITKAQENLDAANSDNRNYDRIQMASLAAKAYASIFLLITGASPTEFDQFDYEDALEVEKSVLKKELMAVKFRAGGKRTGYVVGRKEGLPLLKRYLGLREWILDGQYVDKLFFTISNGTRDSGWAYSQFNALDSMSNFYNSISGVYLDPKYPNITSQKIRKFKSNTQHSARFATDAVAVSLNHSQAVNMSAYAEATVEQQENEFGSYWESVRHAARMVRERSENAPEAVISTGAGHCEAFNTPAPVSDLGVGMIEPNCRTQYGCLYCEHYVCHSDEEDVHKLLSLQYVINAVRETASDNYAEDLYKDLSIRIDFILDAITERSESVGRMVVGMKKKVFDLGLLTPFWESRLQRYEKMGVVF